MKMSTFIEGLKSVLSRVLPIIVATASVLSTVIPANHPNPTVNAIHDLVDVIALNGHEHDVPCDMP